MNIRLQQSAYMQYELFSLILLFKTLNVIFDIIYELIILIVIDII